MLQVIRYTLSDICQTWRKTMEKFYAPTPHNDRFFCVFLEYLRVVVVFFLRPCKALFLSFFSDVYEYTAWSWLNMVNSHGYIEKRKKKEIIVGPPFRFPFSPPCTPLNMQSMSNRCEKRSFSTRYCDLSREKCVTQFHRVDLSVIGEGGNCITS